MPSHTTESGGTWDIDSLNLSLARTGLRFGSDLASASGAYSGSRASAWSKQVGAEGLKQQALMHAFNAGEIQRQGWDRSVLRYDELRREISHQRVTAAGSGIDLSSRSVARAESSSRIGARWDVNQYSRTAQAKSFAETMNAMNSRISSAYATAESKYAKAAGNAATINGIIGALGRAAGGIAMGIGASYKADSSGFGIEEARSVEKGMTDVSSQRASEVMNGWGMYGNGQVVA